MLVESLSPKVSSGVNLTNSSGDRAPTFIFYWSHSHQINLSGKRGFTVESLSSTGDRALVTEHPHQFYSGVTLTNPCMDLMTEHPNKFLVESHSPTHAPGEREFTKLSGERAPT